MTSMRRDRLPPDARTSALDAGQRSLLGAKTSLDASDVRDPSTDDLILAPWIVDSYLHRLGHAHCAEILGEHQELWIRRDAFVVYVPGHDSHRVGFKVEHVGDPRGLHYPMAVALPAEANYARVFTDDARRRTPSGAGRLPTATFLAALVFFRGLSVLVGDVEVEIGSADSPRSWRPRTLRLQSSPADQFRDAGEGNPELQRNLLNPQLVRRIHTDTIGATGDLLATLPTSESVTRDGGTRGMPTNALFCRMLCGRLCR